ncbi:uncharacterized protein LOC112553053, partial [Pogonomyrmex barbatus]|uniref:Uncharacterized protein LOC112553053 n=1 Tax=Pogonomyrmex barbatus TaxID=144034 RepID=A0A8N1SCA9_9HYME
MIYNGSWSVQDHGRWKSNVREREKRAYKKTQKYRVVSNVHVQREEMASEKTSREFDYLAYIRDLLKITYPTEATLYLDGISVVETVQVRNLIKIQIRHPNG